MTRFEVAIGGVGGQGSLLAGRLLAEAGMKKYKYVTFFPNYATLMRGWPSESITILSDKEIRSALRLDVPNLILMHPQFLDEYQSRVRPGGILFLDSSLSKEKVERDDIKAYYLPATELATEIGSGRIANLILLGAYLEATQAVSMDAVEGALEDRGKGMGAEAWKNLLPLNKKALKEGARLIRDYKD
ncbi:MAG: 2-oxoacid:acceptor oxidoreductase family protein [Thermodesulfobacteriota bacterium]|nr:2-oxoacid:acceptor oxidoreductase family protein [Thermodesulfobacteriota bacterium]